MVVRTLFEDFEYTGQWWLPDNQDQKLTGTVEYRRDDLIVDLVGTFHGDHGRTEETMRPRILLGRATSGEAITLLNCSEDGWSTSTGGIPRSTYRATHLLVGKHYDNPAEMTFSEMWLDYSRLEDWMWSERPFFNLETVEDQYHRFEEIRLTITAPPIFRAFVPTLGAVVALKGNYDIVGSLPYPEWTYRATLRIKADDDHDYDWWNDVRNDMQNLLTLLTGDVVFSRRIVAFPIDPYSPSEGVPETVEIYYPAKQWKRQNLPDGIITLVEFSSIKDDFSPILERWFSGIEARRSIHALHFGSYYNPDSYLNYLFLGEMQTLEAYLREQRGGTFLDKAAYEQLRRDIKKIIPALTEEQEQFRGILMSSVKYSNEYPLKRRIDAELNAWSRDLRRFVAHGARFATVIVNTRNYWTHIGEKNENVLIEQHELWHAFEVVRLFNTILMLKDLGFAEVRIVEYLQNSPYIAGLFQWRAWWRW